MSIYQFNPEDAKRFAEDQRIGYKVRGDELQLYRCPYCRNRTDDKNTFAINMRTGQFKCLRATCGAHGNMITLAQDFGFSLGNVVDEYYQPRRQFRNLTKYPVPVVRPGAVAFMESRGISEAVANRYHITTQKDKPDVIVFPFLDEHGKMQFIKYRQANFDKTKHKNKEWSEANCKPILFGMDQCDPAAKTLVLTEGQIDSLSCTEAGVPNAVSVPTGAMGFTWVSYCWDFLVRHDTLIVFGDHENGHITLLDEMRKRFPGKVMHVRPEDYKDCKDANDILRKYGKQAVAYAVARAVPVENPRIKKLSTVTRKNLSTLPVIDTGIKQLNKMLGGFYEGQLIILTGERGLGKSTLASQFAVFAVDQGINTFCYSGELPDWFFLDWFDRQCAGDAYINSATSELNFDSYLVDGEKAKIIHDWYDDRCYIYDNDIVGDEERESLLETVVNAIRQYGCKFILIDNLMTAITDDLNSDLYRQQTAFARALKQIARQYGVTVLLVVHPRKRITAAFDNDDVAGSSNITNLADVILNYAMPKEDDERSPDRILQVTKNRFGGKVDRKGIALWYEVSSKRISEVYRCFHWRFGWEGGAARRGSAATEDGFMEIEDNEVPF